MMGKEQKIIQPSEKKNLSSMRRSLYLSKNINKNSKIKAKDVSIVRPFVSLEPFDLNKVVGKTAKVDLDINMPFFLRNLKN
jgi:sialic acid synthase SpsE